MDWECSINSYVRQITANSNGDPIFDDGDDVQSLEVGGKEYFKQKKDVVIYSRETIELHQEIKEMECFSETETLYCIDKEDTEAHYFVIKKSEKCKPWGHIAFCLSEDEKTRVEKEETHIASIRDIGEIAQSLNVITKLNNKNAFLIQEKLVAIENTILELILSLIPDNPHILDKILKKPTMSRLMSNNTVEVCNCKKEISCSEKESHYDEHWKFCVNTNTSIGSIKIFGIEKSLEEAPRANFDFIGVEINPEVDAIEKNFVASKLVEDTNQINGIWENIKNDFGIWEKCKEWAGVIGFVLSVINCIYRAR